MSRTGFASFNAVGVIGLIRGFFVSVDARANISMIYVFLYQSMNTTTKRPTAIITNRLLNFIGNIILG